jgi:hypothetical protein
MNRKNNFFKEGMLILNGYTVKITEKFIFLN